MFGSADRRKFEKISKISSKHCAALRLRFARSNRRRECGVFYLGLTHSKIFIFTLFQVVSVHVYRGFVYALSMTWSSGPVAMLVLHLFNAIGVVLGSVWIHRNALRGDIRARSPTLLISMNAVLGSYSIWTIIGLCAPGFPGQVVSTLSFLSLGMLGWIQALRIFHYIFQVEIKAKLLDYYEETNELNYELCQQAAAVAAATATATAGTHSVCEDVLVSKKTSVTSPRSSQHVDGQGGSSPRPGLNATRELEMASLSSNRNVAHTPSRASTTTTRQHIIAGTTMTTTTTTTTTAAVAITADMPGGDIICRGPAAMMTTTDTVIEMDPDLLQQHTAGVLFGSSGSWFLDNRKLISPNSIRFHLFIAVFISVVTTLVAWACGAHRGDKDYASYVFVTSWLLVLSLISFVALMLTYLRKRPQRLARGPTTPLDESLGLATHSTTHSQSNPFVRRTDLIVGSIVNTIGYTINLGLYIKLSIKYSNGVTGVEGQDYQGGPVVRRDTDPGLFGEIASLTLATAFINLITNMLSYSLGTLYVMLEPYVRSFTLRHCLSKRMRESKLRAFFASREHAPSLADLLASPDGYWAFRSFLESEFRAEELFFWRAATCYRLRFHSCSEGPQETVDEARHIYMAYLAPDAPYKLSIVPEEISDRIRDVLVTSMLRLRTAPNVYTMAKGPHGAMRGTQCAYSTRVHAFRQLASSAQKLSASTTTGSRPVHFQPCSPHLRSESNGCNSGSPACHISYFPSSAQSTLHSPRRAVIHKESTDSIGSPQQTQRNLLNRCTITTSACSASAPGGTDLPEVAAQTGDSGSNVVATPPKGESQSRMLIETDTQPQVDSHNSLGSPRFGGAGQPLEVRIHSVADDESDCDVDGDEEYIDIELASLVTPSHWHVGKTTEVVTLTSPGLIELAKAYPPHNLAGKAHESSESPELVLERATEAWRDELNARQHEYLVCLGADSTPNPRPRAKRCVLCEARYREILRRRVLNAKDMLVLTSRLQEYLQIRQGLMQQELDAQDIGRSNRPVLFELRPQSRRDAEVSIAADCDGGLHIVIRIGYMLTDDEAYEPSSQQTITVSNEPLQTPRRSEDGLGSIGSVNPLVPADSYSSSTAPASSDHAVPMTVDQPRLPSPFISLPMPRTHEFHGPASPCMHVRSGRLRPFQLPSEPLTPSQAEFVRNVQDSGRLVLAFDEAIAFVFHHMQQDAYPRFLNSYYWRGI